jgi:hypothetical protein
MSSFMPTYGANALQTGGASGGAGIVPATDTFNMALYTTTFATTFGNRDGATMAYGGANLGTEASGTNYATKAVALTASQPVVYTTGSVHYSTVGASATNVNWANTTLSGVLYGVLYDNTSSTKWAIAVYDFGGAQSVTANTFQINFTTSYAANTLWYLVCN